MKASLMIGALVVGSMLGGCVIRPRRAVVIRPAPVVVAQPAPVVVTQPAPVAQPAYQ